MQVSCKQKSRLTAYAASGFVFIERTVHPSSDNHYYERIIREVKDKTLDGLYHWFDNISATVKTLLVNSPERFAAFATLEEKPELAIRVRAYRNRKDPRGSILRNLARAAFNEPTTFALAMT